MFKNLMVSLLFIASAQGATASPSCSAIFAARPKASAKLPDEVLLQAATALRGGVDSRMIAPKVKKQLKALAGEKASLKENKTLDGIINELMLKLGQQSSMNAIGQVALGAKEALTSGLFKNAESLRNMKRGYGSLLLPENDRAYSDPEYITDYLRQSHMTGAGRYSSGDPSITLMKYKREWTKTAPKDTEPVAFTQTGSDANTLLYDIAQAIVDRSRGNKKQKGPAEILYMEGVYGGMRGRSHAMSARNYERNRELEIPNPVVADVASLTPEKLLELEAKENQSLEMIEDRILKGKSPIGGILLEPILGSMHDPVLVYRTEYLLRLRELCDEHGIAIFADEILTGGGRTGQFFAYQHYEGFKPDFVTIGKGLNVAGVVRVKRGTTASRQIENHTSLVAGHHFSDVTLEGSTDSLLKSAALLKAIRERNLIENAREMGEYFIQRLKKEGHSQSRGVGLMIAIRGGGLYVEAAAGRLLPYLTITREEIDSLFANTYRGINAALIRELRLLLQAYPTWAHAAFGLFSALQVSGATLD